MSAPKSHAKRQKLARKRKRKQQARLRRKRKQRDPQGESAPFDAPGGVKMSEVLGQFVRPFEDLVDGEEAYRRLLTVALVAWNAALAPEAEQQKMVDDIVRKGMHEAGPELQATCKELVNQLIVRKKRYFAQYRRPILDFELTDLGDHYYLSVISALV